METHHFSSVSAFVRQKDHNDSALKCLGSVAQHHGKILSLSTLRAKKSHGFGSLRDLAETAESIGFRARCISISFSSLKREIPLPCIIKWDNHGFVVVSNIVQNQVSICTNKTPLTVSAMNL